MASGDVFAVKFHITFAGQECRPGIYLVEGSGVGDVNGPRGCATAVVAALGADPLAGFSAAATLHRVSVQDVQPGTGRTYNTFGVNFSGSEADDNPVPPQDSMLIEWVTTLKGGKGKFARRGRTYMPGIYSTGQISGFLISDLQNALSAFASLLFDPFVTDGTEYQMHAVAFNAGTNPRTVKEIHPIDNFFVDNTVGIQRSRRPGKGI